jgi:hypothetical protein
MSTLTQGDKEYYARRAQEELALMGEDMRSIQSRTNESLRVILRQIAEKLDCLVDDLIAILRSYGVLP